MTRIHIDPIYFRHVALAYQQYSINSSILAENQQERSSRLKACTKIIAAVVSEVMEAYMVGPMLACKNFYSAFCTAPQHRCNLLQDDIPADLVEWCQERHPSGVLAFCSQWAQTLYHVSHRNADSHPFE
ncbi:TPA: hypothetical protein ACH3X1_006870 [Trebouxia sp. C0004]